MPNVITREHVQELLGSRNHDSTLVVLEGKVLVVPTAELGDYRGAVEVISRNDLAAQLGSDVSSEQDLDELAARLNTVVQQLGG